MANVIMPAATNDYRQQINSAYQSFSPFHFIYYNNEYPRHTKRNRRRRRLNDIYMLKMRFVRRFV